MIRLPVSHGLVLCTALLAAGCRGEAPAKGATEGRPPARVAVGTARAGSITAQWSFLGDVEALRHAELAAGAAGEVRKVLVHVGDRVKRGTLLVEIDPSLAAARLRAAKAAEKAAAAQLERARRDAERLNEVGPDATPKSLIEQANQEQKRVEAERRRVTAGRAEARAELGRHRVTAPFDGVIARRAVDPGDWVDPGVEVVELIDDADVQVLSNITPEVAARVSAGDTATLEHEGQTVPATIRGVVRALDEQSRTVRLRLVPDEMAAWLLPGTAVDVLLRVERQEEGAIVVPRDALVYGIVDTKVVKVIDGKAAPIAVKVVATGTDEVLVRGEGLAAGDSVVTRGNERLRPGQPVQVAPKD